MTNRVSNPSREPFFMRLVRGTVALVLALAITTIAALFILGYVPAVQSAFKPLFEADAKLPRGPVAVALAFFIVVPALFLFWPMLRRFLFGSQPSIPGIQGFERRGRYRWLNWRVLGIGWAVVLPILIWLAWDDSVVRQPIAVEEFSPAFPGADQSYAVLMRYSTQKPSEEAKALAAEKMLVPGFGVNPQDADKWLEFVKANRAGLEADWTALAPERRWLEELNKFERIGDLTPAVPNPDIVTFQPWRTLAYHACGIATVQALDGNGDLAIETLLPLLEVSRKLQASSRTLLRSIIAEVPERMTMQTAALVLDKAPVSAAARAKLSSAISGENAAELARRLVMGEFVQFAPVYFSMKMGDALAPSEGALSLARHPLNLISSLLLNPKSTINLYGDHIRELAALAEARDLSQFYVQTRSFNEDILLKPGIKNLGGRLMIALSIPSYDRALESHWKTADIRDALRKRLAAAQ